MELKIIVLIGLFIILVIININTKKFTGGDNHDDIDDIDENNQLENKGQCSLEEIQKHNNPDDKWIYHSGIIYNLNSLIKKIYVPQISDKLTQDNFNNLITLFEKTDLQDFSKISKSIDDYNIFVKDYLKENNEVEIISFNGTENEFNNFISTFLSIININEIKKNIICPAGLSI